MAGTAGMVATAHLYIIGIGLLVCPSAWVANKDLALANGKIPCRVSQQSRRRVSNMNDAYAAGTVTGSVPGVGTVGRSASSRVRLMRSCNSFTESSFISALFMSYTLRLMIRRSHAVQ